MNVNLELRSIPESWRASSKKEGIDIAIPSNELAMRIATSLTIRLPATETATAAEAAEAVAEVVVVAEATEAVAEPTVTEVAVKAAEAAAKAKTTRSNALLQLHDAKTNHGDTSGQVK